MNLQFNNFDPGNYKMPNNLEIMIRKSGMLRKEVAERMGIRPETVSRHVSGALQFSIKQANMLEYLNATPKIYYSHKTPCHCLAN